MYSAYRECPRCGSEIIHTAVKSQKAANFLAERSTQANKLCRSCIATEVNTRRWADPSKREKQSQRFLDHNPSKGKPAWNRGVPRDEDTKQKIRNTIQNSGGRLGDLNTNYGNFKFHNLNKDFKQYANRVRVLTERVRHSIPGYDEKKRGKAGVSGAYQIDHIKSIIACWYDGDSAEQAADLSNLRFVSWSDNLKVRKWSNRRSLN